MWSFGGQEIGRALIAARAVFAGDVVPELVSSTFGEEVGSRVKTLSVVKLGFDGVMDTFDIGVGIRTGGRVEGMLGAPALLDGEVKAFRAIVYGIAIELSAQIGGNDHLASIDLVLVEMFEESFDRESGGGFDPVLFGEGDQLMTKGELGVVSANHRVVSFVGGWRSTRFVYHTLVSPDVRRRCPPFLFFPESFSRRAPLGPPLPPGGAEGRSPPASPQARAATTSVGSMSVERYIGFCAAGNPAARGHEVPGPRRILGRRL